MLGLTGQNLNGVKDTKVSTMYSRPGGVDSATVSQSVTHVSYAGTAVAHSANAIPVTSLLPRSHITSYSVAVHQSASCSYFYA